MKTVRNKFEEIMKERNISQKELSRMTNIRPATLSMITRNKVEKINMEYLAILMHTLELKSFDDVFELTDQEE